MENLLSATFNDIANALKQIGITETFKITDVPKIIIEQLQKKS